MPQASVRPPPGREASAEAYPVALGAEQRQARLSLPDVRSLPPDQDGEAVAAKAKQPSLDDDARAQALVQRDERILRRLETMRNYVLDRQAREAGWLAEIEGLIAELRG